MADGHLNACKECVKAGMKLRWEVKSKDPIWMERERVRTRMKSALERANGTSRQTSDERKKAWYINNRDKIKAQQKARYAILHGKLDNPGYCQRCGSQKCVQMHHHDYSQPLSVIWLCASCHGLTRRKNYVWKDMSRQFEQQILRSI